MPNPNWKKPSDWGGQGWGGPAKGAGHRFTPGDPVAVAGGRKGGKAGREAAAAMASAAELARVHVPAAIDVWSAVMADENMPAAVRVLAAQHIVERAEGRPVQPTIDVSDPASMTDADLDRIISRERGRLETEH